jgi:hypothetical protein
MTDITLKPGSQAVFVAFAENRTLAHPMPAAHKGAAITALRKYGLIEKNEADAWDLSAAGWTFYRDHETSLTLATSAMFFDSEKAKAEFKAEPVLSPAQAVAALLPAPVEVEPTPTPAEQENRSWRPRDCYDTFGGAPAMEPEVEARWVETSPEAPVASVTLAELADTAQGKANAESWNKVTKTKKPQHNEKVLGWVAAVRADLGGLAHLTDHDVASKIWRVFTTEQALKHGRKHFAQAA